MTSAVNPPLPTDQLASYDLPARLLELRATLETLWSAETSVHHGFSPAIPSRGQCVPTALLVEELFGGQIMRTVVLGESHYYNLIADLEVDLTRDQFPLWVADSCSPRTRSEILSSESSKTRSELLSSLYHARPTTHSHHQKYPPHTHHAGAVPHDHILRAICGKPECRGYETHNIHHF